ncbi:hypothetical protein MP638_003355, partial [Amoeboaphelidium occidentale]
IHFRKQYKKTEINNVYNFRDKKFNWKSVLERFMRDNEKFAMYFYGNSIEKFESPDDFIPPLIGGEHERIGREIGDAYASSAYDLTSFSDITNDVLQETIFELRRENPDLAKTGHWHFFE